MLRAPVGASDGNPRRCFFGALSGGSIGRETSGPERAAGEPGPTYRSSFGSAPVIARSRPSLGNRRAARVGRPCLTVNRRINVCWLRALLPQ